MNPPAWILREVVGRLHRQSLREFGGTPGVVDEALIDAALDLPRARRLHGQPDLFDLAACHAFAVLRNPPFEDGNKRTAFLLAVLFLELNGQRFGAPEDEATAQTLDLAAGRTTEAAYAAWLRRHSRREWKPVN